MKGFEIFKISGILGINLDVYENTNKMIATINQETSTSVEYSLRNNTDLDFAISKLCHYLKGAW